MKIINRKKTTLPTGNNFKPYAVSSDDGVPAIPDFGIGYRFNITGLIHDETGFPTTSPEITKRLLLRLRKKIESGYNEIRGIEINVPRNSQIAVLSYGASYRSASKAAKDANVGIVKLTTLFPFPEKEIRELAQKVKTIIVVEMNLGQIVHEVERASCGSAKVIGINIADGQLIAPEIILEKINQCR